MNKQADIVRDEDTEWIESPEQFNRVMEYVAANADADVNTLYLKSAKETEANRRLLRHAIDQILARKKYLRKFSIFLSEKAFIFPSILSAEQATHQAVARYHASIFGHGKHILDMTAGLGIDALTAARSNSVVACELDPAKAAALRHNATALSFNSADAEGSLTVENGDSMQYLENSVDNYDIIFADPARRSEGNARVFNPADCMPDVVTANSLLLDRTERFIVKHSPMLDVTMASRLFPNMKAIHIVCHRGELKEVLTEQQRDYDGETEIICTDILNENESDTFAYRLSDVDNSKINYVGETSLMGKYLSIPNAAIMKTGAWNVLQVQFPDLQKLDINSHIFLSDIYPEDFPGHIFEITGIVDKKDKSRLKGSHCNVIVCNYPLDADRLAKSLKVIPGSDRYLIATRHAGHPIILDCKIRIRI